MDETKSTTIEMVTEIVSAYVANNAMSAGDLPNLITSVHAALTGIATGVASATNEKPEPAVPLRKAVQPDFIVDLFTGKQFKSLKRHIRTAHNMTPEEYRAFWGLPNDSPMVAPNYATARSELAKASGLGRGSRQPAKGGVARKPRTPAT